VPHTATLGLKLDSGISNDWNCFPLDILEHGHSSASQVVFGGRHNPIPPSIAPPPRDHSKPDLFSARQSLGSRGFQSPLNPLPYLHIFSLQKRNRRGSTSQPFLSIGTIANPISQPHLSFHSLLHPFIGLRVSSALKADAPNLAQRSRPRAPPAKSTTNFNQHNARLRHRREKPAP